MNPIHDTMLMGKDKDIDLLIRRLHHILDHSCYFRFGVRSGYSNTAVDQDLVIGTIMLSKADEDAIAETLTVDTHRSGSARGPCRLLLWGFGGSWFLSRRPVSGLWLRSCVGRPATQRLRYSFMDLPWRRGERTGTAHFALGVPGGAYASGAPLPRPRSYLFRVFGHLTPAGAASGSFGSGILGLIGS